MGILIIKYQGALAHFLIKHMIQSKLMIMIIKVIVSHDDDHDHHHQVD